MQIPNLTIMITINIFKKTIRFDVTDKNNKGDNMKIKKLLAIIILISLIISGCSSDGGTQFFDLYGKIVDNNGKALENVSIKIMDKNLDKKTNGEGIFKFKNLNRATYKLEFKKNGYNSKTKQINLNQTIDLGIIQMTTEFVNPQEAYGNAIVKGDINLSNNSKNIIAASSFSPKFKVNRVSSLDNPKISAEYINNEVIIQFNKEIKAKSVQTNKIDNYNISDSIKTKNGKLVRIKVPKNKTIEEVIEYFKKQSEVNFVEPNYKAYAQASPNDSHYEKQWNLIASNLEAAWDQKKYSDSVTVAVLDTGLIPRHIDLKDNILNGANFIGSENDGDPVDYEIVNNDVSDKNSEISHGTHVSGIIGALTDNSRGVAGVSWGINIIPVKVLDKTAEGSYFDIAQGIYYAVDRGADIINMSLGGVNSTTYLKNAVQYAVNKGVIIVSATGNTGGDVLYPAAYPETISVGSINRNYDLADYSNYGSEVDLVAPGTEIYSTTGYYQDNSFYQNYRNMSGTSMAAAHVSGIAALLLESGVNPQNVRERLTSKAVQIDDSNLVGAGLVDAYGSLIDIKLNTIPVKVFAGSISNNAIYIRSNIEEIPNMNYHSNFEVVNADESELYIIGWRDINNNNVVDIGDYFGISEKEKLSSDGVNNIDLNMFYVSKETSFALLDLNDIDVIMGK